MTTCSDTKSNADEGKLVVKEAMGGRREKADYDEDVMQTGAHKGENEGVGVGDGLNSSD